MKYLLLYEKGWKKKIQKYVGATAAHALPCKNFWQKVEENTVFQAGLIS